MAEMTAGEHAAHAIRDWVAVETKGLLDEAARKNAELLGRLDKATRDLGVADQEVARLSAELGSRPTSTELLAAQMRAREAAENVTHLTEEVTRLQRELEARPPMPDELLTLVRQDLGPVFIEFHRQVEEMEPKTETTT